MFLHDIQFVVLEILWSQLMVISPQYKDWLHHLKPFIIWLYSPRQVPELS